MKKLLLSVIVLLTAAFSYAQPTVTTAPVKTDKAVKAKQVQNPAAYACPKCYMISKGAGKCEHCQVDKVQLGTYYCPACMKGTGNKAGNCPTCNKATVQMTRKYCAAHQMKTEKPKEGMKR